MLDLDEWEEGLSLLSELPTKELRRALTQKRQRLLLPLKNQHPDILLDMLVRIAQADEASGAICVQVASHLADDAFVSRFLAAVSDTTLEPPAELVTLRIESCLATGATGALDAWLRHGKRLTQEEKQTLFVLARRAGNEELIFRIGCDLGLAEEELCSHVRCTEHMTEADTTAGTFDSVASPVSDESEGPKNLPPLPGQLVALTKLLAIRSSARLSRSKPVLDTSGIDNPALASVLADTPQLSSCADVEL